MSCCDEEYEFYNVCSCGAKCSGDMCNRCRTRARMNRRRSNRGRTLARKQARKAKEFLQEW